MGLVYLDGVGTSMVSWGLMLNQRIVFLKGLSNETIILPTEIVCADANEQIYVDVSCGWKHSLLLLSNGIVYSSGSNIHGQLGMDNTTTKCLHSFHKVPTHRTASNDCKLQIINICCGWQHSSALGKIVGQSSSSSTLVLTWGQTNFSNLEGK